MRVCVYGAGAVGGQIAAKLAAARYDVSVVVRGATLQAIRQGGLRLRIGAADRAAVQHLVAARHQHCGAGAVQYSA